MANSQKIKVVSTVDAVGLFCPMPVVRLKLELEKVNPNDRVRLLADDPGVCQDLPAWCNETGNSLISLKRNEEGIYVAYVEKNEKN